MTEDPISQYGLRCRTVETDGTLELALSACQSAFDDKFAKSIKGARMAAISRLTCPIHWRRTLSMRMALWIVRIVRLESDHNVAFTVASPL